MSDGDEDPLLNRRTWPRDASTELRERLFACIGPDIERLHLLEVRLAVQERLHKEFGIHVVIQDPSGVQNPMDALTEFTPITLPVEGWTDHSGRIVSKQKSHIPIPNHRRKWWER